MLTAEEWEQEWDSTYGGSPDRSPPREEPETDDYDLDVIVLWRVALAADGIITRSWPGQRIGREGKPEAVDVIRRSANLAALSALVSATVPIDERAHVLACLVEMARGHIEWEAP